MQVEAMVLKQLEIKRDSGWPVSEQIASFVRSKIYAREIQAGSKLPTTLEMMEQFGVGTHTVRRAIQSLKKEGLVKSIPRLGTIVNELETDTLRHTGFSVQDKDLIIAVTGLVQSVGGVDIFRPETAEGILRECERRGALMLVLPGFVLRMRSEALCQRLSDIGCRGLIYHCDELEDDTIARLSAKGIEAITVHRFKYSGSRTCIESDFEGAGYSAGLYYYSLGCHQVTIFSHYELTCSTKEAIQQNYPLGIKPGLCRAYESKGVEPDIAFYVNKRINSPETSQAILTKLESLSPETGVVFTNAYQLLDLFKTDSARTRRLLDDKHVIVVGNKTVNLELERYVKGLRLMVLLDSFEEVGKKAVSMLIGVIKGYVPRNSRTMSDIKLVPFDETL